MKTNNSNQENQIADWSGFYTDGQFISQMPKHEKLMIINRAKRFGFDAVKDYGVPRRIVNYLITHKDEKEI